MNTEPPHQFTNPSYPADTSAAPPAYDYRPQRVESYCGHQVFACIVCWFCNILFGFTAWILALYADDIKIIDHERARRLGKASLGVAISGILVTIIIVAIILTSGVWYRG